MATNVAMLSNARTLNWTYDPDCSIKQLAATGHRSVTQQLMSAFQQNCWLTSADNPTSFYKMHATQFTNNIGTFANNSTLGIELTYLEPLSRENYKTTAA